MIDVKNLVKEFQVENHTFRAVDDVSFHVDKGEIYGIIGLSGAGKSTVVRCINRLEEPTSGRITIDGVNITALNDKELLGERKDIGMIFQSFNLFHQKTVYENIAYPLEIMGVEKSQIKERVMELLKFIDLEEKINAYPSEMSGGQKQRVAIARAIATKPKILLSDEGTSALDPANTKQVIALLKKIVKEMGMTIIMITHQMEVAKDICDSIAVMEDGKIIEENTVENLFRAPKHKRTLSFIQTLQDEPNGDVLKAEDFEGTLFRLTYKDESTKDWILNDCIKKYDVNVNVLAGKINTINESAVGYLIIEMRGDDAEVIRAKRYLEEQDVNVEVM